MKYEVHALKNESQGCRFVTGQGSEQVYDKQTKQWKKVFYDTYCDKIREFPGGPLCPHHNLIVNQQPIADAAKMQKLRDKKVFKKEQRDSLATSPLAAVQEVETGYWR